MPYSNSKIDQLIDDWVASGKRDIIDTKFSDGNDFNSSVGGDVCSRNEGSNLPEGQDGDVSNCGGGDMVDSGKRDKINTEFSDGNDFNSSVGGDVCSRNEGSNLPKGQDEDVSSDNSSNEEELSVRQLFPPEKKVKFRARLSEDDESSEGSDAEFSSEAEQEDDESSDYSDAAFSSEAEQEDDESSFDFKPLNFEAMEVEQIHEVVRKVRDRRLSSPKIKGRFLDNFYNLSQVVTAPMSKEGSPSDEDKEALLEKLKSWATSHARKGKIDKVKDEVEKDDTLASVMASLITHNLLIAPASMKTYLLQYYAEKSGSRYNVNTPRERKLKGQLKKAKGALVAHRAKKGLGGSTASNRRQQRRNSTRTQHGKENAGPEPSSGQKRSAVDNSGENPKKRYKMSN
uniref:Uncharacterized protein n=2 Tax=Ditylum brightwellii TaxID=49249 RepID=A0A7S4V8K3_9STRA